jgi:hypothetical protein
MTQVGSIELKMSVPGEQRMALLSLSIDPLMGRLREVWFFDTPDLTLFKNGLVVRARRTQGSDDDTVIKLRPCAPNELPAKYRKSPNLKVEMDVTSTTNVVSASLKGTRPAGEVRSVLTSERRLEKLFSKEQRSFFDEHVPEGVRWEDLVPLGPNIVVFLKWTPPDFTRRMTLEQWHFPGQAPLVELSTKCAPDGVLGLLAELLPYLDERNLTASGEQEPKTRTALEFFASQQAAPALTTQ